MGNEYCGNDAIGIIIARELSKYLKGWELKIGSFSGFDFIEAIEGYNQVVIIDSLYKEGGEIGRIYKIDIENFKGLKSFSYVHSMNLYEAYEIAKKMQLKLPEKIIIFGIGIDKKGEIGETISPMLERKICSIVNDIMQKIKGQ